MTAQDASQGRYVPASTARGRLLLHGARDLSDAELLAQIIGGQGSHEIALRIMEDFGSLDILAQAHHAELLEVPGLGEAKLAAILAAFELRPRADKRSAKYRSRLTTPTSAVKLLRGLIEDVNREQFVVLGLDARQCVRHESIIAVGSVSRVEVHPREVFRPLIKAGLHSCIIAHNHPSGDSAPSESDVELTDRLKATAVVVGIPVLDHIIVTATSYSSMAELGLI